MKIFLLVVALLVASVNAQIPCIPPNGGAASNVIGAPDFVTSTGGAGLNQLRGPYDVETDIVTFKIFVTDFDNNRVLRYPDTAAFTNGAAAEASFGAAPGCSATQLNGPSGVAIQNGVCFFSDVRNNRVVRLANCATAASGAAFTGVFGQTSFTVCSPFSGSGGLNSPEGITLDFAGSLYVADYNSNVIKKYINAATAINGAIEAVTFGTYNSTTCTQTTFLRPSSLDVDPFTSTMWVADEGCNRVVGYQSVSTQASGAAFTFVIGQTSFTASVGACAANALSLPADVSYDGVSNSLFVADAGNNRVLAYFTALTVLTTPTANAPANAVLGQAAFTTCAPAGAASASSLRGPFGVHYDAFEPSPYYNLFVADTNNSRVLRFECVPSPSISVSPSTSSSGSNSNSISVSVSNSISRSNNASVVAPSPSNSHSHSRSPSPSWTVTSSHTITASGTESTSTSASASPDFCGNGDLDPTEQCDPGQGNFNGPSCCNPNCQYKQPNSKCGPRVTRCFIRARCRRDVTGAVACAPSRPKKPGKFCKTSSIPSGVCDGQGVCVAL